MKPRVLIVDDEEDIVFMMRMMLELAGYEVLTATTGEDGLDAITRDRPDVVVLDLRLPGIDGWTVLERLREGDALPCDRVIVVSAHGSEAMPARAAEAGVGAYLRKPFATGDLLAVIRDVVHA